MTNRAIFPSVMELFVGFGVFLGGGIITLGGGRKRGESRKGSGETD